MWIIIIIIIVIVIERNHFRLFIYENIRKLWIDLQIKPEKDSRFFLAEILDEINFDFDLAKFWLLTLISLFGKS